MDSQDTFFRSSDMSLTQLYIVNEVGREVVSALGEIGLLQFRDVSDERMLNLFPLGNNLYADLYVGIFS